MAQRPDYPGGDDLDDLEIAAGEWVIREEQGLSAEEEQTLMHWLQSDPRHAELYGKMRATWRQMEDIPADRLPLSSRRERNWWRLAVPLAAAAAVAIGFFAARDRWWSRSPDALVAATPVGGFEQLRLADGSIVHLNTASRIAVGFSAGLRRVDLLEGEASFAVAKDTTRPFVVRVGALEVRAVGTEFNVRHRSGNVEVLVTEGRVRVEETPKQLLANATTTAETPPAAPRVTADPVELAAGERITVPAAPQATVDVPRVTTVPADEIVRSLAWKQRRLEFKDEPLSDVVAEFNRYNAHRLVIADAELGRLRFGGKFPADDFSSFVRLLEADFGVAVERRPGETLLKRSAATR